MNAVFIKQEFLNMTISHVEIHRQLKVIIAHPDFKVTQQTMAFFKCIVNQTLAGNARQITDRSIATIIFGRNHADYDQHTDPIVSIQADVLRRSLASYYRTAGKKDPIRISLPEGTYSPVFTKKP